jgi:hypothetical protein
MKSLCRCHCRTRRVKFDTHGTLPRAVQVIFIEKEVAMGAATEQAVPVSPVSMIPTLSHTHSFTHATAKAT